MSERAAFVPPPYPYDRLDELERLADERGGGCIDLSVGTPCDPPPAAVVEALGSSGAESGYPPSVGTPELRLAARDWMERRLEIVVEPSHVAACVGTKELVALVPQLLRLRDPRRDTILYPAVSYPTYAMGAELAGCRPVPVPVDDRFCIDLDAVDPADAERALALWVNTPGNPAGGLDDLDAVAAWGRERGIPVFSDECYVEFTWSGEPRTILRSGTAGVIALHSLSKRSNLAGLRAGFYVGDPELVNYLASVRKHVGLMVAGPVQAAATVALRDDDHVDEQRSRYRQRLRRMAELLGRLGIEAPLPDGGFYLWVPAPGGDAWGLARRLAEELGVLVSPGEFYGAAGSGHVRIAVVQRDEAYDVIESRMAT